MIIGITALVAFELANVVIIVTPGPDTLYVLGRSVAQGRSYGSLAAIGVGAGTLIHTSFAAFGLSALFAHAPEAFQIVKAAGAMYLLFQALQLLRSRPLPIAPAQMSPAPKARAFGQGIASNLLNPKAAVFFVSFLPQFVPPDSTNKVGAMVLLGLIHSSQAVLYLLLVARFSARLSEPLRASEKFNLWLRRSSAAVFTILGLRLLIPETRH